MSTSRLPNIPALRKHGADRSRSASLQHAAPPGTYVSLSPGDPTLWLGVIFVRSGPYASAVLRFQIRFPASYPDMPPLVNFATDVFHPLIVPLTTYTFSTGASSEDPVSATDDERLPPGGFSLRHGFPHWFGRAKRAGLNSNASVKDTSGRNSSASGGVPESPVKDNGVDDNVPGSPAEQSTGGGEGEGDKEDGERDRDVDGNGDGEGEREETEEVLVVPPVDKPVEPRKTVPASVLLDYIRSTFDDEAVLDSLPLEAAGNPSAWHAWKAHRKESSSAASLSDLKKGSPQARLPGDWHWDGIWARRVQNEIEASSSDATLFGNVARGGVEEMIRFSRLDDTTLTSIKEIMIPRTGEVRD
ncbi:ubiquitin-conjugating enzyme [Aspergillus heteromorphus CBS 117.55]|uniref:Ubiquitin-conjugating enzyme n=1 Tax=Aspergillus heteromorphus CBS 117.55 TaxID=1448321 RepID=A0A317WVH4_9EURO|nr:ubiquitin-conjugating enzyme [Aspergillus heteromorphus CBS 117.55]PWY90075.1 ubiquitin-conjugating enzyme [Aspergillus heteromorphus CBS 117.55]